MSTNDKKSIRYKTLDLFEEYIDKVKYFYTKKYSYFHDEKSGRELYDLESRIETLERLIKKQYMEDITNVVKN